MNPIVVWISLTPVKGLALDLVDEIELLESGPRGDRRFYLIDEGSRLVNNKGRKRSALQLVHGSFDETTNELTLRLADGREISERAKPGEELQTFFHSHAKTARRVAGPWDEVLSELVDEPVRLVAAEHGAADRGRSGAATLLGVASLETLASELGVAAVDGRRFRMNFGIDGLEPHAEDAWIGARLRIGEAIVVPQGHVGRCVITTQNPDSGESDLDTLKALAAYRGHLEVTEPLPFGVHAAVAAAGRVRVGDPVLAL